MPARQRKDFGAAHLDPSDAYAGVPILQEPKWHGGVAAYFYFGGISSGSLLLGAIADLSGERWRTLARTAHLVSFTTVVPCAPLLIADLGRPQRFHHMLRIFKPSSPMNLGSWTLVVHSGISALLAAQALAEMNRMPGAFSYAGHLPPRVLGTLGLLPALTLGGYTGVLLGTTSVPLWSRSSLLGGLFMASAIATGTSAVSLASIATGMSAPIEHNAVGVVSIAAGASELALVAGFLATSGASADPLRTGREGTLLLGAVASTVIAVGLEIAAARLARRSRVVDCLAASATLAGGAMLRWAIIRAGHASAADRDATLAAMRSSSSNSGWGPTGGEGNEL